MFSQQQVKAIENELAKHRYITENKRAELSSTLNLTEMQVKTWFQNRRTKWRKDLQNWLSRCQKLFPRHLVVDLSLCPCYHTFDVS